MCAAQQEAQRAQFYVEKAKQDQRQKIIQAEGEAEAAKMVRPRGRGLAEGVGRGGGGSNACDVTYCNWLRLTCRVFFGWGGGRQTSTQKRRRSVVGFLRPLGGVITPYFLVFFF